MRRCLADPFHLGDEIPTWQAPAIPPRNDDVRSAIAILGDTLRPASSKHIAWCVGTMAHAMGHRKGDALAMALKTEGWLIACGDLPEDLWTEGVKELLQTKTWFPAPAELLAIVGPKFRERRRMLDRAKIMLASVAPVASYKPAVAAPVAETPQQRLASSIEIFTRRGMPARAANAERQLAKIENREPADWARIDAPTARPTEIASPPAAPESPAMHLAMLPGRIRFWRAQGNHAMADKLQTELDGLTRGDDDRYEPEGAVA